MNNESKNLEKFVEKSTTYDLNLTSKQEKLYNKLFAKQLKRQYFKQLYIEYYADPDIEYDSVSYLGSLNSDRADKELRAFCTKLYNSQILSIIPNYIYAEMHSIADGLSFCFRLFKDLSNITSNTL